MVKDEPCLSYLYSEKILFRILFSDHILLQIAEFISFIPNLKLETFYMPFFKVWNENRPPNWNRKFPIHAKVQFQHWSNLCSHLFENCHSELKMNRQEWGKKISTLNIFWSLKLTSKFHNALFFQLISSSEQQVGKSL